MYKNEPGDLVVFAQSPGLVLTHLSHIDRRTRNSGFGISCATVHTARKGVAQVATREERFTTQGGSDMLVLSRKIGERIIINDTITVEVLQVVGNRVRLGITAPDGVPIMREELLTAASNSERKKETILETAGAF
jgi:carbon storage regulator